MFTEFEESRKAIGDVDVVFHDGLYHLFHLVLPNHDFIAHAVSTNGVNWRRVNNALFLGDPGAWDDLMLWTMHVSPDPNLSGRWRMFYTGLSRREQGRVQRIGLAFSDDLYHWDKAPVRWEDHRGPNDPEPVRRAREIARARHYGNQHAPHDPDSCLPLEPDPRYYEASLDDGRGWISFRDPFFFREDGTGRLLMSSRVRGGPAIRRGCIGRFQETSPGRFEARPALHHPGLYDDVEVPSIVQIEETYYLIGSIREDAKIRYWYSTDLDGPWRSYHDNVLMAQGNYAGRICRDDTGWLLWCFFSPAHTDRTHGNLLPPPKRLQASEEGLLRVTPFEGLDDWLGDEVDLRCIRNLSDETDERHCRIEPSRLDLLADDRYQAYLFDATVDHFRFRAHATLRRPGKCGLLCRIDPETQDGYYLSLDLFKGIAQLRRWRTGAPGSGEHMMEFAPLQSGNWFTSTPGEATFQLLVFGSYIECAIDGRVILSLADPSFSHGRFGVYLESAELELRDVSAHRMRSPDQSARHLIDG